ncbi:MAG: GNAT family N-acetyltransferase, partial [Gemmatimonadaceae bacterium]
SAMPDSAARIAGLQLRRAQLVDASAVANLHIASWRVAYSAELPADYLASLDDALRAEQWLARMSRPTTEVLLAEADRDLLGFCAHGPMQNADEDLTSAWEIYSLHVRPRLRGGGIGTILFSEALLSARRAGAPVLTLWVVATNAPARRFYEGKGMQPDGAQKDRQLTPGIVLHEVRYRLSLASPAAVS